MNRYFDLYDLRVEVHQQKNKPMVCNHPLGNYFILSGENIIIPEGMTFPIYCMSALIPILPAKQRETSANDWMTTDHFVACPDPNCGGLFKIIRLKQKTTFLHHHVTKVELPEDNSRIINGCWQLAAGHSQSECFSSDELLMKYVEAGLTTFDCADIYTGVEQYLGSFAKKAKNRGYNIKIHTKYVPNLTDLAELTEKKIRSAIQNSCKRLQTEQLELVQFHCWDYKLGNYLEILGVLQQLKSEGLIKKIGLTNFDTSKLQKIVESGIEIESIQVQYSLLDKRPEKQLIDYAKKHNIKILAYGVLCGGFLTNNWLLKDQPLDLINLTNRSLIKYKLIIDEFGGWNKFQSLLQVIQQIAGKYGLSIAEFVVLYMLRYSAVDSLVLGVSKNFNYNPLAKLLDFKLSNDDLQVIADNSCAILPGDVYSLERDMNSKHAQVMRYDLNDCG